jgi:hypothetical protein
MYLRRSILATEKSVFSDESRVLRHRKMGAALEGRGKREMEKIHKSEAVWADRFTRRLLQGAVKTIFVTAARDGRLDSIARLKSKNGTGAASGPGFRNYCVHSHSVSICTCAVWAPFEITGLSAFR